MVQTRTRKFLARKFMNATAPDNYLVREESIQRMERIVFALSQAAKRCDESSDKITAALRVALSARCERCGTHVTGEELLVFSGLPAAQESARVKRLRSGHCARAECAGDEHRLIFQNHPDLDWAKLFASGKEPEQPEQTEPVAAEATEVPKRASRWRTPIRVGILIGMAVLLFVLRQLYYGGRIPLLREPEQFRVDPAPHGTEAYR